MPNRVAEETPQGLAAVYARACGRCGARPNAEVAASLVEDGLLSVDLRLCTPEALEPICGLLREAPPGIRRIELFDGLATTSDIKYRKRVEVQRRRRLSVVLEVISHLRLLIGSLSSFLSARGQKLVFLDLTGVPLGRDHLSLCTPLLAALRACKPKALRWLCLAACRIADRGFSLLGQWLTSLGDPAPSLEALTLSRNALTDVRLVGSVLRARAKLCSERRVVPLRILDLSGNARLSGARVSSAAGPHVLPKRCSGVLPGYLGIRTTPHPQLRCGVRRCPGVWTKDRHGKDREKESGRPVAVCGGVLLNTIACAISEGLPLQTLRLRSMRLEDRSLRPMQRILDFETRRCVGSEGRLANTSGFCLEELDLTDNPSLGPGVAVLMRDVLDKLKILRNGGDLDEVGLRQEASGTINSQSEAVGLRRSASAPDVLVNFQRSIVLDDASGVPQALIRDVVSDGCALSDDDGEQPPQPLTREALQLRRIQDRRDFRASLAVLTQRQSKRQLANDFPRDCGRESRFADEFTFQVPDEPFQCQSWIREAFVRDGECLSRSRLRGIAASSELQVRNGIMAPELRVDVPPIVNLEENEFYERRPAVPLRKQPQVLPTRSSNTKCFGEDDGEWPSASEMGGRGARLALPTPAPLPRFSGADHSLSPTREHRRAPSPLYGTAPSLSSDSDDTPESVPRMPMPMYGHNAPSLSPDSDSLHDEYEGINVNLFKMERLNALRQSAFTDLAAHARGYSKDDPRSFPFGDPYSKRGGRRDPADLYREDRLGSLRQEALSVLRSGPNRRPAKTGSAPRLTFPY